MQIRRTCCICGKIFYAAQSTQAYCSKECKSIADNRRYYDKFRKNPRNTASNEAETRYSDLVQFIRHKEYLTVTEAAILVGVSRPTMYTYIKKNNIPVLKPGRKTLIARDDLNGMKFKASSKDFLPAIKEAKENTLPMSICPKSGTRPELLVDITNYRSMDELATAHNIGTAQMRKIAKKSHFKKYSFNKKIYLNIDEVETFFRKEYQTPGSEEVKDWYSIEDIHRIYGISPRQIALIVSTNKIPKKRMGRIMLYAKHPFDAARGIDTIDHSTWISFKEVTELYGLTDKQAMGYATKHSFQKMKVIRTVYTLRADWEKWRNENAEKVTKHIEKSPDG